jgi:adenylate kinase
MNQRARNIIFVGGVHGAGKTTLGRRLAEIVRGLHVTAGALILAATPNIATSNSIQNKTVRDIESNQERLLQALSALLADCSSERASAIILDGHFCLLHTSQRIVPVPTDVFRAIAPAVLVLVETDRELICERQASRGATLTIERIGEFQALERKHAQAVSLAIGAPLHVVSGSADPDVVAEDLASQLQSHFIEGLS